MSMSFGALITLGFLGNRFVPLAGRFMVRLLSLRTHIDFVVCPKVFVTTPASFRPLRSPQTN